METFKIYYYGLPSWLRQWIICLQYRRPGFDPWVGKIPWRRKWLPTPAFLPGEFHGQWSLVGYSPWGHKELDMLEWLSTYAHTILITLFWYFFMFWHTRSLKTGSNPPILYSKGLHWNVGCARPHPPLNHLVYTLCFWPPPVSYHSYLWNCFIHLTRCELNFQQPVPHLHPMVKVPSLCCSLGKPFESFVVFVADAFQGNPQAPPWSQRKITQNVSLES